LAKLESVATGRLESQPYVWPMGLNGSGQILAKAGLPEAMA
jgi:hypothetical protein